jgi:hypothetical protein
MTSLPFGTDLFDIALNRLRSMRIPISSQLPELWFLRKKERPVLHFIHAIKEVLASHFYFFFGTFCYASKGCLVGGVKNFGVSHRMF